MVLVLFDAGTAGQVIPAFERYVGANVPADLLSKYGAMAIGARREPKEGELLGGISSYGLAPPRRPSSGAPRSLAEAVGRARDMLDMRSSTFGCWQLVFSALRELLVLDGLRIDGRWPSARQLERWLADHDETLPTLRGLVCDLVFMPEVTEDAWRQAVLSIRDAIREAFGTGDWSDQAKAFVAFSPTELGARRGSGGEADPNTASIIGVDTIHNSKGETHAATIVLECKKNRTHDLKEVLSLLAGNMPASRRKQKTIQGICQLAFVAVTRPRVCLGLAVAKEHAAPHLGQLMTDGWEVLDLTM